MKKLLIISILVIFGCVSLPVQKDGFDITFYNNTDELACYTFNWVDHGLTYPYPASMCGGELVPGKRNIVEEGYHPGLYIIYWYSCRASDRWSVERTLEITNDIHNITTTPEGEVFK